MTQPIKTGRKPLPPDQRRDRIVKARVTADEAATWEACGGAEWLRAALSRARKRREKESK